MSSANLAVRGGLPIVDSDADRIVLRRRVWRIVDRKRLSGLARSDRGVAVIECPVLVKQKLQGLDLISGRFRGFFESGEIDRSRSPVVRSGSLSLRIELDVFGASLAPQGSVQTVSLVVSYSRLEFDFDGGKVSVGDNTGVRAPASPQREERPEKNQHQCTHQALLVYQLG